MASTSPTTTLRDEQQLTAALLKLMKHEQQLLVSADTEGLAASTQQKSQLIAQLAELSSQRHRALGSAGFAAQEAGMEPWLARGDDPSARALWQDLLSAAREAKELNRVNGMLINKQMIHNQAAINALRTPAQGAGIYGPSGHTTTSGPSRRLIVG